MCVCVYLYIYIYIYIYITYICRARGRAQTRMAWTYLACVGGAGSESNSGRSGYLDVLISSNVNPIFYNEPSATVISDSGASCVMHGATYQVRKWYDS